MNFFLLRKSMKWLLLYFLKGLHFLLNNGMAIILLEVCCCTFCVIPVLVTVLHAMD